MPFGQKEFQDISRTFGFKDTIQGLQAWQNEGNYILQLCAAIILPATLNVILISWKIWVEYTEQRISRRSWDQLNRNFFQAYESLIWNSREFRYFQDIIINDEDLTLQQLKSKLKRSMNHPNMATLIRPNLCDLFLVVEQHSAYECFFDFWFNNVHIIFLLSKE